MQPNQSGIVQTSQGQSGASQQTSPDRVQQFYEQLRAILIQATQSGIPGADQILNMVSQQYTKIVNPNDKLGSQPATPQNPTPQGSYSPFG